MTTVAIMWFAAVAALIVGVWASPDHTFRGYPAGITILALLTTGSILAAQRA